MEVPGVSVSNFLRTAKTAIDGQAPKLRTWVKDMKSAMADLKMDASFAERDVNAGFSGGQRSGTRSCSWSFSAEDRHP